MSRVEVLLSTYNGERFLVEQLDSLLAQTLMPSRITVRDDGSTDNTRAVLGRYAETHPGRFRLLEGGNVGVVASFFELLRCSDATADFVAFCDQDDVWHANKLAVAVERLSHEDARRPLLYCSRVERVDAALRPLGPSPAASVPTLRNALVENVAIGCTSVMNAAARARVLACLPEQALMHDGWCALVVAAFGRVIFDPVPRLAYRQHGGNVIGAAASPLGALARNLTRVWRREGRRLGYLEQARAFETCHGDRLAPSDRRVLERFLASERSLFARVGYALTKDVYRQRAVEDLLLRALIVLGRL